MHKSGDYTYASGVTEKQAHAAAKEKARAKKKMEDLEPSEAQNAVMTEGTVNPEYFRSKRKGFGLKKRREPEFRPKEGYGRFKFFKLGG